MRILFTLFIFTISFQIKAQNEAIHSSVTLNSNAPNRISQETDFAFTAIALKSSEIRDFSSIGFIHNADTLLFSNNLHSEETRSDFYSSLIHFDKAIKVIDLNIPENMGGLEAVLINGSGKYSDFSSRAVKSDSNNDCELTGVVQQSEWRAGLPSPSYSRNFTTVNNMIVHHSAGSNNITDYTQAVRDIYIFHTEENGWSDIGYNYLVAPDGVIYAGRDPGTGDQDQVMGAHFCGSNSNTMGVCLLGNYEIVEPTEALLVSLEEVLSWKAFKDNLEVLESSSHPLNSNLGVVAGHQDGCSTLCPGENVYNKLQEIRVNVNAQLAICRGEVEEEDEEEEEAVPIFVVEVDSIFSQKIYPNPIKSDFSFSFDISENRRDDLKFIRIFNQEGKQIAWENLSFLEKKVKIKLPNSLKPGLYFLQISFSDGEENSQRFVIPY